MDHSNRIPADKSKRFGRWAIPEVHEGQLVSSERLNERGSRGELVNIDKDEVLYRSLTAAQLEEITLQCYEEIREQAEQDGYQQGLAEGQKAGLVRGQQLIDTQLDVVGRLVEGLTVELERQRDDIEQALMNLVCCVARSVVHRELRSGSEAITDVVAQAVAALPQGAGNIRIQMNPTDLALLNERQVVPADWQLVPDEGLSPGGVRVLTQQSVVDFTLDSQFQQTVNALVEARFAALDSMRRERDQGE